MAARATETTPTVAPPETDATETDAPEGAAPAVDRVAELEAENAALRELVAKAEGRAADPVLPDGYVYVIGADGLPVQGIPFAPAAWLKDDAKHLLPEGAHKATKDQHVSAAKAAAAAARSGNPR